MNANPGARRNHRPRGTRQPVTGMFLTDRDRAVLREVFLQRAVTRKQLMRLGLFGSVTTANERLRLLFDHGLLQRSSIATGLATCELVYTLGRRAVEEIVRLLGIDRNEVVRSVEAAAPLALAHCLSVTNAKIALTNDVPDGLTVEWLAEPQVRHEYHHGNVRHVLKPDGALLLTSNDKTAIAFVEVDRGNVSIPQFTRSCISYRRYVELDLPHEIYGATATKMICIVHAGERRLTHLLEASRQAGLPAYFALAADVSASGPYKAVWRCSERPNLTRFYMEVV